MAKSDLSLVAPPEPPYSLEAEQSLLGSLLIDRDAIIPVATVVEAGDFYRRGHQLIYQAVRDLYDRRVPADFITVAGALEERGQLEAAGNRSYLLELTGVVPTAVHAGYYAGIVADKAARRRLIEAGTSIVALGQDQATDLVEVLERAERGLAEARRPGGREYQAMVEVLGRRFEALGAAHGGDGPLGVPTGYADLDALLGGLQRGDLALLAARPSVGKTAWALGVAAHVTVRAGGAVGMYSLEMSADQLVDRLISMDTGIDMHRLRRGRISDAEWDMASRAFGRLSEARLWIDDTPGLSIGELRARARRLAAEQGVDLVIVDYLQLLSAPGRKESNRVQEVGEISRGLKALARELGVPVLALSQLSRAVEQRENRVPRLSDLRESGSLEQDADVVLFIHRPGLYDQSVEQGVAEVHVSKHRNGPTGQVGLTWLPTAARFVNLAMTGAGED